MAAIKPVESSAEKWTRRSSVAGPDYRAGITNPRTPWATAAANADQNYRTAVTAAANAGRYAGGVRRAGNERWSQAAQAKGPGRYAEGVALATGQWASGFSPYAQAIQALTLPSRGPTGSPQNLQRVSAVANALRQLKERQSTRQT